MCCAVSAVAGSCAGSMGELGSPDKVSNELLGPEGKKLLSLKSYFGESFPRLGGNL